MQERGGKRNNKYGTYNTFGLDQTKKSPGEACEIEGLVGVLGWCSTLQKSVNLLAPYSWLTHQKITILSHSRSKNSIYKRRIPANIQCQRWEKVLFTAKIRLEFFTPRTRRQKGNYLDGTKLDTQSQARHQQLEILAYFYNLVTFQRPSPSKFLEKGPFLRSRACGQNAHFKVECLTPLYKVCSCGIKKQIVNLDQILNTKCFETTKVLLDTWFRVSES